MQTKSRPSGAIGTPGRGTRAPRPRLTKAQRKLEILDDKLRAEFLASEAASPYESAEDWPDDTEDFVFNPADSTDESKAGRHP
jgi:hypothetical protein